MNFWDIVFGTLRFIMVTLRILFFPLLILHGLLYNFKGFIRFNWVPRTKEIKVKGQEEPVQKEYLDYEIEFTQLLEGDKITQLSTLEFLAIFIAIPIIIKRINT